MTLTVKKVFLIGCLALLFLPAHAETKVTIYISVDASAKACLAAREVRRYFYLVTGTLPEIATGRPGRDLPDVSIFLVTSGGSFSVLPPDLTVPDGARLSGKDSYWIKTVMHRGKKIHLIVGRNETGLLYGAYAFAEQLGVRFYLDGDVLPVGNLPAWKVSVEEKRGTPLFDIRGIQPFHDFPEGPDWWTRDDYKAVFSQILRLKMNFFGLHTYPEGGVGPEPLVWIGTREELGGHGDVKSSYPSRHFTNMNGTWGFKRRLTSAYSNRMGDLFDDDVFGTSYMKGIDGWPAGSERENALFDTVSGFFSDVFAYAKDLGIMTCVGTETPLVVPARVREHLVTNGMHPADSTVTQLLYEGMFEWVKRHYPVNYYWFWTPEDWTWRENTPEELRKTGVDLNAAIRAAHNVNVPFTLATCGWVLGPVSDRSYFDRFLPKTWPMSCINRYVGFEPIEEGFTRTEGRPLWAIPWLEDDPGLSLPQLWVGRMRRDAVDAAAYGCTGLIGIHWRTRILGPNVAALASAGWEQPWNPRPGVRSSPASASQRKMTMNLDFPSGDFYRDWAKCNFGGDSSDAIAAIFSTLDGGPAFVPDSGYRTWLPRPADWMDGPGGVKPDTIRWERRSRDYRFVDELEGLGRTIVSPGAHDRFDYWLNVFRYLRAVGKFSCTGGEIRKLSDAVEKEPPEKRAPYWDWFVSLRKQQIGELEDVLTLFLRTVSTKGELGTVANWQQHIRDVSLEQPASRIQKLMGKPLPDECWPSNRLLDVRRMIIPTVRNTLRKGETLTLDALFYGPPPERVFVKWRRLGRGEFESLGFRHVARNVYTVSVPAGKNPDDIEYYIEASGKDAGHHLFPPGAPRIRQSVVVF